MTHGLLISAPRSGSGKTIVSLGLMRAFARRGLRVAAIKNGPDYIDPAFHAAATGRASVNLDTWAMAPDLVTALATSASQGADLLLCEGSMGLFDGVTAPPCRCGASSDLAAVLGLPVLLVLDISGQSQTAAAVAKGCDLLDPAVRVGGVILNRVASERHRLLASEAIERVGLRVVGALPRHETLALPSRHLGLVQADETRDLDQTLDAMADFVAAHVDLEAIRGLARPLAIAQGDPGLALAPPAQRIAVARDEVFTFLYPHILEGWRRAGAEILTFSPLADMPPPDDADLCWLPGGYPELHAARLAASHRFLARLRRFAETRPVHGECGGYMVLGEALIDAEGESHPMAGLLGLTTSFAKRKMQLGYRAVTLAGDCVLGTAGTEFRGHEFHYATVIGETSDPPFALAADARGSAPAPAGSRRGRVTGSFFHLVASGA